MWSPIRDIGYSDSTISTVEATAKPALVRMCNIASVLTAFHNKTRCMLQANTAAKHWPGYQTYPDPQLILESV